LLNVGKSGIEVLELSIDLLNGLLSLGNLLEKIGSSKMNHIIRKEISRIGVLLTKVIWAGRKLQFKYVDVSILF
jgi:hypothetical protein